MAQLCMPHSPSTTMSLRKTLQCQACSPMKIGSPLNVHKLTEDHQRLRMFFWWSLNGLFMNACEMSMAWRDCPQLPSFSDSALLIVHKPCGGCCPSQRSWFGNTFCRFGLLIRNPTTCNGLHFTPWHSQTELILLLRHFLRNPTNHPSYKWV